MYSKWQISTTNKINFLLKLDICYEMMIAGHLDDHVHLESDIFTHKKYVNK